MHSPTVAPSAHVLTGCVTVYADRYHSIISLPLGSGMVEEWAFGERIWFYEEKDLDYLVRKRYVKYVLDICRALCLPNRAVIQITRAAQPFTVRNPQDPIRVWNIPLGAEALRRLREWLERALASREPLLEEGAQCYYPATMRYHFFHTCHHFIAEALCAAGLPLRPGRCAWPSFFWNQLDRLSAPGPELPKR